MRFAGLAFLLAAAIFALLESGIIVRPSFSTPILVFVAVMHMALYYLIVRYIDQPPGTFVKVYLGMTVLRIVFFGIFIFALIRIDPPNAWPNAAIFLVCYFSFTALEVGALFMKVNARNRGSKFGQKGP